MHQLPRSTSRTAVRQVLRRAMFDVGFGELLLIVLVILLLFGPKKLPDVSRTIAKGLAQVRKAQAEFHRNLNLISEEIQQATESNEVSRTVPESSVSRSPLGNGAQAVSPPSSGKKM